MSRRVILNAMIAPYDGDLRPDDEVWCLSGAVRHQRQATRCFAMDDLCYFPEGWADEVNLLPKRIRFISLRHYDEIPRSEPYPIKSVVEHFHGLRYMTSTFAYMLALAIYEGFDEIVLSGALWREDSEEYMQQLACCNFWLGAAMGKGIHVSVHGPCALARAYVWEPPLYGYETNGARHVPIQALAAVYRFCAQFPYQPRTHVDVDKMLAEEASHAVAG